MHTALDFIEEKLSPAGKPSNDARELYLGQLYAAEDYKLYPFIMWFISYFTEKLRELNSKFPKCMSFEVTFV